MITSQVDKFKRIPKVLFGHKVLVTGTLVFTLFIAGSLVLRGALIRSFITRSVDKQGVPFKNYLPLPTDPPTPLPIDSASPSDNSVLGVSSDTSNTYTEPSPLPSSSPPSSPSPLPTYIPITTNIPAQTSSPSSGNPDCTTGNGVPNSWYSDVYPASSRTASSFPLSATTGSTITLSVYIRDCFFNSVSNDRITISLSSGDPSTQINGSNSPVTINTQGGVATFTLTSQNTTTDTFIIKDIDSNFLITTANPVNQNPTVNFGSGTGSSSCASSGACCSEAVFPSGSYAVGSNVPISINFSSCNNSSSYAADTITVTPKSVDASFQFVGFGGSSFTLPAGQTSFQVTAQNPSTNTFTIWDSTKNFEITGSNPPYSTPTAIFTSSSATPSPSASPTPSPSPSANPSTSPSPSTSGTTGVGSTPP